MVVVYGGIRWYGGTVVLRYDTETAVPGCVYYGRAKLQLVSRVFFRPLFPGCWPELATAERGGERHDGTGTGSLGLT